MSAQSLLTVLSLTVFCMPLPSVAAEYAIDSAHTYPSLEFSHMGISVWRGKFNQTTGAFTYDAVKQTGNVDITVDTASIDFGHDEMNEHARNEEWLNVEEFPAMTYTGDLKFTDGKPSSVEGKLTLLGVTKPLTLELNSFQCIEHPYYKKEACGADAKGSLNRADYGLTQYTDNGMGVIDLRIQVEAMINEEDRDTAP